MPIDEKLITPEVLNNTLIQEIYPEIKVIREPKTGKVRVVYPISENMLLMMSSDNLSTHDVVHKRQVYGKGANLDAISSFYFDKTRSIIQNHFVQNIAPNTWLVERAEQIMIEMVFRKTITGSLWKGYAKADGPEEGMEFCGVQIRPGYRKNEMLDAVISTPTAKGQVKDFAIPEFKGLDPEADDPKLTADIIRKNYKAFGLKKPEDYDQLEHIGFALYDSIGVDLDSKGAIMADTKWEFGYSHSGRIILIDECVTPDSSRIWLKDKYVFNEEKNEFTIVQEDKQEFRDHIESIGLEAKARKTELAQYSMPDDVMKRGVIKYCNIRERITGTQLVITTDPMKEAVLEVLDGRGYLK